MYCHRAYKIIVNGHVLSPGIISPGMYCHRAYTVTGHILSLGVYCLRACIVTQHILSSATICVDVHGTFFSPAHNVAGTYRGRWQYNIMPMFTAHTVSSRQSNNSNKTFRDDDDDADNIMMIIILIETCYTWFLLQRKVHHTWFTDSMTSESLHTAGGELFFQMYCRVLYWITHCTTLVYKTMYCIVLYWIMHCCTLIYNTMCSFIGWLTPRRQGCGKVKGQLLHSTW